MNNQNELINMFRKAKKDIYYVKDDNDISEVPGDSYIINFKVVEGNLGKCFGFLDKEICYFHNDKFYWIKDSINHCIFVCKYSDVYDAYVNDESNFINFNIKENNEKSN